MVFPIGVTGADSLSFGAVQNQQTDFAQFLASQLQNQDLFSPVSVLSVLQDQLAVSQIKSQLIGNLALADISTLTSLNLLFSVSQSVGKTIHYADDSLQLVNGQDTINYKLESAASKMEIEIFDANGNQVTITAISQLGDIAPKAQGDNTFVLNTQDNSLNGDYTFNIHATNANGEVILATPFTIDTIQSAVMKDNLVSVNTSGNSVVPLVSILLIL